MTREEYDEAYSDDADQKRQKWADLFGIAPGMQLMEDPKVVQLRQERDEARAALARVQELLDRAEYIRPPQYWTASQTRRNDVATFRAALGAES